MKIGLGLRITLFTGILIFIVVGCLSSVSIFLSAEKLTNEARLSIITNATESSKRIEAIAKMRLAVLGELAYRDEIKSMDWDRQKMSLQKDVERLEFLDMAVVKPDGTARYVLSGETSQLGDREYIKKAFEGKANISDVLISKVTNGPVVMYAVPIEANGRVTGVLIGRKEGTELNDITDGIGLGENGYAYLVGVDGTIYSHPDRENVLKQRNILKDIEENGEFKAWGEAFKENGTEGSGVITYELDGKKIISGLAPIPDSNWVLGVCAIEDDILRGVDEITRALVLLLIAAMLVGLVSAFFIGKSIGKPIVLLSQSIKKLSNYDLTPEVVGSVIKYRKRRDEIGMITDALSAMHSNFVQLISKISDNADKVDTSADTLSTTSQQASRASEEVAMAIQEIAAGASGQARDTEEGAAKIEEMRELLAANNVHIDELARNAEMAGQMKDDGLRAIAELVEKTAAISESSKTIRDVVESSYESADKIEKASQMIRSIAEQTNLLALNAAIEAARAGENGKGFAVVAEEIRKLAEDSNKFTKEIGIVIRELMERTKVAVQSIQDVSNLVALQGESVDTTKGKLEGIASAIEKTSQAVAAVNNFNNEVSHKKDEVTNVIQNLSALAEENAAGTEEASASVEEQTAAMEEIAASSMELSKLAEEMKQSIASFKM